MMQNTITLTTSANRAISARRTRRRLSLIGIAHYIQNQWADGGFIARGEARLHRRRLARFDGVVSGHGGDASVELEGRQHERQPVGPQRIGGAHDVEM